MTVKVIPIYFLTLLLLIIPQTISADVVTDTVITIANPAEGEQALLFPKIGLTLEYRVVLKGQCPASSYEGDLYPQSGSSVVIHKTGQDSAALFITFGHCENNPVTYSDVNGKTYQIQTGSRTLNLEVSEPEPNTIRFIFDDPAVSVGYRALPLNLPNSLGMHYNVQGRAIASYSLVSRQALFTQP